MQPDSSAPIHYVPGPWVAFARTGLVLLAELDPASPIVQACWEAADRGAGVDDLLGVILREGLRSVPGFAIAAQDADGYRVLVSGKAAAAVAGDEPEVLSAADAPTWLERRFAGADGVRLTAGGVADQGLATLPLGRGVVLACAVTLGTVPDAPAEVADPELAAAGRTERLAAVPADPQVGTGTVAAPGQAAAPAEAPADAPPAAGEATRIWSTFDHLFGSTDNPPAEPAASPPVGEPAAPPPAAPGEQPAVPPPAAASAAPSSDTVLPRAPDSGTETEIIEALPWQLPDALRLNAAPPAQPSLGRPPSVQPPPTQPAHPTAPPAVPLAPAVPQPAPAPVGQAPSGHTVDRASLPGADQPMVLATACPNRHLGPPHASTCRVCGAPVPQQEPFSVPRPPLGVLHLSTGDMVPLDRDVVLGRAPSAAPDADPHARPHLVQLSSPGNDISRTHLRVDLEGWHVQVIDLGSTNGTIVTLPGQQPVRLRAHDPFTIVPGTIVNIADEVQARFEVTG